MKIYIKSSSDVSNWDEDRLMDALEGYDDDDYEAVIDYVNSLIPKYYNKNKFPYGNPYEWYDSYVQDSINEVWAVKPKFHNAMGEFEYLFDTGYMIGPDADMGDSYPEFAMSIIKLDSSI